MANASAQDTAAPTAAAADAEEEICLLDTLYIEADAPAAPSPYEQLLQRRRERWLRLAPSLSTVQYAGDIGLGALGIGWDYGRNERWETHLQLGFLPKGIGPKWNITLTLRENYVPWSLGIGSRRWADPQRTDNQGELRDWNRRAAMSIEPLVATVFINTIFDDEFWVHEPEKYNGGSYYRFPSQLRLHLGIGQRLSLNIPQARRRRYDRASLYYTLSTYDLAIITAATNEKITLADILTLGIGLQYKFF